MTYRTICADPPWEPALGANWKTRFTDKARPQKHYRTMSVADIALPLDTFPGVEFHAEILIFNVQGVRPHYFLSESAL